MIARRTGFASPADLPLHLSALAGICVKAIWSNLAVLSYSLVHVGGCGAGVAVAVTTPLEILRQRGLTEWMHRHETKHVFLSQGLIQAIKSVKTRCRAELQDKLFRVAPRSAVKKATYGFFKQAIIKGIQISARAAVRR